MNEAPAGPATGSIFLGRAPSLVAALDGLGSYEIDGSLVSDINPLGGYISSISFRPDGGQGHTFGVTVEAVETSRCIYPPRSDLPTG
jgi:hypothetical protein